MIKKSIQNELDKQTPDYDRISKIIEIRKKEEFRENYLYNMSDREKIEMLACACFGIEESLIKTKSRVREVVWARRLVWWYYVRKKFWTYARAGNLYGKDHATVLQALRVLDDLVNSKDKMFVPAFKVFKRKLRELEL